MPIRTKVSIDQPLPFFEEADVFVSAPREQVFAIIDQPARLAGHMSKRSWKMGGGRMELDIDSAGGRRPGSRMRLHGRVFGVPLSVDTEVTRRDPPEIKVWRTVGEPHLLVIGPYSMTVKIGRTPGRSRVAIRIDYALASTRRAPLLKWLARTYARWCVRQIALDVGAAFADGVPRKEGLARVRS